MSRARAAAFLITLLAASAGPLFSETTVLLATGPDKRTGIPYLSANVIPYLFVTYLPAEQAGSAAATSRPGRVPSQAIQVSYSAERIVPDPGWKPQVCGPLRLLTVQPTPPIYFFQSGPGWGVFFDFPAPDSSVCSFVTTFVDRFQYFLGVTQDTAISSFPAVLRIP